MFCCNRWEISPVLSVAGLAIGVSVGCHEPSAITNQLSLQASTTNDPIAEAAAELNKPIHIGEIKDLDETVIFLPLACFPVPMKDVTSIATSCECITAELATVAELQMLKLTVFREQSEIHHQDVEPMKTEHMRSLCFRYSDGPTQRCLIYFSRHK